MNFLQQLAQNVGITLPIPQPQPNPQPQQTLPEVIEDIAEKQRKAAAKAAAKDALKLLVTTNTQLAANASAQKQALQVRLAAVLSNANIAADVKQAITDQFADSILARENGAETLLALAVNAQALSDSL